MLSWFAVLVCLVLLQVAQLTSCVTSCRSHSATLSYALEGHTAYIIRMLLQVTLLTSIGVNRRNQFPFNFLNSFGVLDAKKEGEQAVIDVRLLVIHHLTPHSLLQLSSMQVQRHLQLSQDVLVL